MDIDNNTLAIVASVIGVGVALWRGNVRIHNDLNGVKRDIADLRERMARLEGVVETLRDTIAGRQTT